MARTTHLNSLQALEIALREGSFQGAAENLGITPAAVGQRIRALEQYLDTDLILRGRSGLRPTPALEAVRDELHFAFAALGRVTDGLDFQRTAEIHIVADPDWSDLWLLPRLDRFKAEFPNILFNVNGEGDVPVRLGAADIIIDRNPNGRAATGEVLFSEIFLPVGSPENTARITDPDFRTNTLAPVHHLPLGALDGKGRMWRHTQRGSLEGFPLLHVKIRADSPETPNWTDWLEAYPLERTAPERGVQYALMRNALDGVKSDAGLLVCGLSCILDEVDQGTLNLPFPAQNYLRAACPYRVKTRSEAKARPQVSRFLDWLSAEVAMTRVRMDAIIRSSNPPA